MSDPDHSIMVRIEDHPEPIDLDDLTDADEVFIFRSQIVDISGYWAPSVQISGAVFLDCNFDKLPDSQREVLIPYSDRFTNSFCIPYETKRQNKSPLANR